MSAQTASKFSVAVTSATANTITATGIDVYAGYVIVIVTGTGAGQMRYAPTSPGTNQLTITKDWDTIPDATSTVHVARDQADYDVDFGNKFKLVLKATEEWDAGDFFTIGNSPSYVVGGMIGQAISLDDYWEVQDRAFFVMGYLAGANDITLGGWYWNSNNSNITLGYKYIRVLSGGTIMISQVNCGTVYQHGVDFQSGSTGYIYDVSFSNLCHTSNLLGALYGTNLKWQGKGDTNDYITVNTGVNTFEGPMILSNTYGLVPSGTSTTIIMNKYESVNPVRDCEALSGNVFEFRSPSWGDTSGNPIVLWTDNGGTAGWDEKFALSVSIKSGATAIANARFAILENSTTPVLVNVNSSDANGLISDYILKRRARTSAAITTYTPNLARCWKYDYQPFQANIDPTQDVTLPIPLVADTNLVATEATALTYSDITATQHATPMTVVAYDGGTGSVPTIGETITAVNGATGVVVEYIGDAVSGYLVLDTRNATAFIDNNGITGGTSTFSAQTNTVLFNQDYTWEIDANTRSMQQVYDYLSAKYAMATPDAWVTAARIRGLSLVSSTGTSYYTTLQSSEGVWVSNRGSGTIDYFTSDAGVQFVPPASYTYTVAGIESGSEARLIEDIASRPYIDGIETVSGSVKKAAIYDGGSGYTVSDVLTVVGGTGTAATLTVTSVNAGVITGVSITNAGSYTVNPPSPSTVTGGTGTGAQFTLTISGEFSYTYTYSVDIPFYVVIFHLNYKDVRLINRTLTNADQTDTVQQIADRTYRNP